MGFSQLTLWLLLAFNTISDAVTIILDNEAKPYTGPDGITSESAFYHESIANEFVNTTSEVLMSSFYDTAIDSSQMLPSSESFVRGAIQAWGEHLHLIIRPEELWFTILMQMSLYMKAHASEMETIFHVVQPGQDYMFLTDYEFYRVIQDFKNEAIKRVRAPWFMDWVYANWTTSSPDDGMAATIIILGQTKLYKGYEGKLRCGIPSITLLGEIDDWKDVASRLARLPAFGAEAAAYQARLEPILRRIVSSFTDPDSAASHHFWQQIVSARPSNSTCGPYKISGWITGFLYWDDEGKPLSTNPGPLKLDNTTYPAMDIRQLPVGYTRTPFRLRDYDDTPVYSAYAAAGTLGKRIVPGPPDGYADALSRMKLPLLTANSTAGHSTLQSLSGWVLYGPANYNMTPQRWLPEVELTDMSRSIRKSFNGSRCGIR